MALRAALLLASLLSTTHSTTTTATTACPPPMPTTYTLITPSPSASPIPVTSQGQLITSHIPQYAICNPDRSDCTTVYSPTTYAWCSTTLPCYQHSCTVTDCTQPITFSHDASYHLASTICTTSGTHTVFGTPTHITAAPTTLYYVEPVTTRYVLPYTDYVESRYDEVVVERCTEVDPAQTVCEVSTERWIERVSLVEEIDVLPVTLHTYCEKATTVTWAAGESVVVERPSTVTWVTGSTRTSTLTSTVTVVAYQTMPQMEYDATVTVTTDCTGSATYPTHKPTPMHQERGEFAGYEYETAGAGRADGQVHSYGQYKDHAEAYEYSTGGAGASYKDSAEYPAVVYTNTEPALEERGEFAGYEYETSGAGKADGQVHSYGQYKDHAEADEYSTGGAGASYKDHAGYPTAIYEPAVEERGESAGYEYETAGAGKADGQVHSYGQYKDHAEAYEYSTGGSGASYKDSAEYPAVVYTNTEPALEERGESAGYEYETTGAGRADGQVHSYGQYKDHAEAYEYSTGGAGASYKDSAEYPAVVYEPAVEERGESAGYEYETAGAGKADGQVHSYGQYKDHAEAYEYSTGGSGASYKDSAEYPAVVYTNTEPALEERGEFAGYEYETSGAGKADGQVHSYGQYKDHAEADEYSTGGAGASYKDHAKTYEYGTEAGYSTKTGSAVEERDEFTGYEYETSGAGKAAGEKHSYGQYADYSVGYEYSTDGAGATYSDKPVAYAPVAVEVEERGEVSGYRYETAGAGKADGQAHDYGQYKNHAEAYEYSTSGAGAGYSTTEPAAVDLEERSEFSAYEYEADGAGKASGEKHSYGQYADHAESYEYSKSGAGVNVGYPKHELAVEERDEYSDEQAGYGRKSGEAHSYGQYADYSDEYEYEKGQASSDGDADGNLDVATANASGEYGHKASGERHSYGQYQDYEMEVKHEYENEASIKASKQGWNSYSYGVEKAEYE